MTAKNLLKLCIKLFSRHLATGLESWLITTAQKGNNGVLDELTLVIFGNDKRYVACEQFPLGPERSELYEATINLYLRALREQKQPKSTY